MFFHKEGYEGDEYEDTLANATNYYYTGKKLIQEFDEMIDEYEEPVDELQFDYQRGVGGQVMRRRQRLSGTRL